MDGMLTVVQNCDWFKVEFVQWFHLDSRAHQYTLCISCCIDVEFLDFDGAFLFTVLFEVIVFCC